MKVFLVEPQMTMSNVEYANQFNGEIIQQFIQYGIEFHCVNNNTMQKFKQMLSKEAIVLVYNEDRQDDASEMNIKTFLDKAENIGAEIWPIALDKGKRIPAGIISKKQSYDIWEQLRCRNLGEEYLTTIARIFSRKVIARVCPTLYCEKGEIFLSHRRIDGEEITANIYDKIQKQLKQATLFRDVVNVKVGKEAQPVIDRAMKNSDVFIFIHTPEAAKSDWIVKELRFALLRNIPILWVQIDDAKKDSLKVKPSEAPHLTYCSKDLEDDEKLTIAVDKIIEKAFQLIINRSFQVLEYIEYMKNMFGDNLRVFDSQKMIYHISMERKGYHYPQRNIEQYYQLYGRTPTLEDAEELKEYMKGNELDSLVILTNRIISNYAHGGVIFDNIQDFCCYWDEYINAKKKEDKTLEIVILGAFPDSDEIFKQSLTDALFLFAKAILRGGYNLTFGAHPTFQELFYEIAKEEEPINYKDRINMYISRWFLKEESDEEKEYGQRFTIKTTDRKDDLQQSLTEMRKNMIQRENVKAVVCLGGKVKNDKNEEGIREEIELAREYNIPVFIVGSVGGCSAEVAMEYKEIGWNKLNNASDEINQNFLDGINYYEMAEEMMRNISSGK